MIYLNTPTGGGETNFALADNQDPFSVRPTTGLCLVFDHQLTHEGALMRTGVKYVLRTDVMFTRRSETYAGPDIPDI